MPSKLSNLMAGLGCLTPITGIVLLCYFLFQSSISLGVISIVLSFVLTIVFIALGIRIEEKRKVKQLDFLQTFQPDVDDFHKLKSFTSYDLLTKIAIDDQRRKRLRIQVIHSSRFYNFLSNPKSHPSDFFTAKMAFGFLIQPVPAWLFIASKLVFQILGNPSRSLFQIAPIQSLQ